MKGKRISTLHLNGLNPVNNLSQTRPSAAQSEKWFIKNGNAQKQVLYIEYRPTGEFKVKSNSMQNAAIVGNEAQVAAKATYLGVGNFTVISRVIDNGEPGANDLFGLKLIDGARSD